MVNQLVKICFLFNNFISTNLQKQNWRFGKDVIQECEIPGM